MKSTRAVRWLALLALPACLAFTPLHAPQDWRPLALASFDEAWQIVNDRFYDPTFRGVDWQAVRAELRPKAEAAASADDVRRIITEMIGRLNESHFVLLPSGGALNDSRTVGPATVPIDVRVVATGGVSDRGQAVIISHVDAGSVAEHAGLRAGQLVTRIDGTEVSSLIATAAPVSDTRAAALDSYRQVIRALHGDVGTTAIVVVTDGASAITAHVERVTEGGQIVTMGNLPPLAVRVSDRAVETSAKARVGVIAFNYWMAQIDKPVAEAVDRYRQAAGLVFDLRGNPGGLAAMIQGIAGQFMNDDTAVLGRMKMRDAELTFHPNPRRSTVDGRRVEPFDGPVAILVDELTGSASECFAAAVQSLGRARVFGRPTMGAALPASTKKLADGDVLMYVVGDFVTSNGRRVEGPGVTPDEVVALTPAGFQDGRDPDLDAALAWIARAAKK
jgi:carboxyl-terminal processing protease